jgi:hypothetical protein
MHLKTCLAAAFLLLGCSEYDLHGSKNPNGGPDESGDTTNDGDGDTLPVDGAGGLSGRICSPAGNTWVANARVWVEMGDGTIYETFTDADGYFTLNNLPPGIHTVYVQKGSFSTSFDVEVFEDFITEMATEECLDDDIAVAVLTGDYDTIEHFLTTLGISHDLYAGVYDDEYINFLRDPAKMSDYDIIFINCNTDSSGWSYGNEIGANLRNFIQDGGSVYASDYSYWFIEKAVPNANEFPGDDASPGSAWGEGDSGYVYGADIVSPDLQAALGKTTVDLNYDTVWVPIDSTTGSTLIQGTYPTWLGSTFGPLVTQYDNGGTALYTSFHNEAQATADMERLIEEFVFSL